jgi:hypothetical protein
MFKTVMIAAFLILMTLIWINRERVYLRDPIATVYRDGVEQSGIQVFQNYSDDVLIEKDSDPAPYRILIQGWNQVPGTPAVLRCMRWMACLADEDHAATYPLDWSADASKALRKSRYDPHVSMTNRETSFTDAGGTRVRIVLR